MASPNCWKRGSDIRDGAAEADPRDSGFQHANGDDCPWKRPQNRRGAQKHMPVGSPLRVDVFWP